MRSKPLAAASAAALAAVLLPLSACGDTDDASTSTTKGGADCGVVEEREVTIVARDLAWVPRCFEAPEGVPFTVVVDNQDDGVNHDFHLSTGTQVLKTPLEMGPVTQRLEVPALDAGQYGFLCEIHPDMTGTLEVLEPLSEGPEG